MNSTNYVFKKISVWCTLGFMLWPWTKKNKILWLISYINKALLYRKWKASFGISKMYSFVFVPWELTEILRDLSKIPFPFNDSADRRIHNSDWIIDRKIDVTTILFLLIQNRQQSHDWPLIGSGANGLSIQACDNNSAGLYRFFQ